ncbi:MAG: hypothetical protein HY805_00970 [Nitrospirae bacterium]|nr:hypothetical protein [Nitrospirota bacterium]
MVRLKIAFFIIACIFAYYLLCLCIKDFAPVVVWLIRIIILPVDRHRRALGGCGK